jgi:lactoylglutathione lyase
MKFGYTIIYVPDVFSSLTFFETAFGFSKRFIDESGTYGELDTGETTLSFASHSLGVENFTDGYISADSSIKPCLILR